MTKKETEPNVCLIPVDAQPPTFGMVLSIMAIADNYDEIVICVKDQPIVQETDVVVKLLQIIFKLPKYMVISNKTSFETIAEFPEGLPFFNHMATLSERVYANLFVKGFGCLLIPRLIGYDDMFSRNAWKQSCALDILRANSRQVPLKDDKPAPSAEEDDE